MTRPPAGAYGVALFALWSVTVAVASLADDVPQPTRMLTTAYSYVR
jgi:hypothetical protein